MSLEEQKRRRRALARSLTADEEAEVAQQLLRKLRASSTASPGKAEKAAPTITADAFD